MRDFSRIIAPLAVVCLASCAALLFPHLEVKSVSVTDGFIPADTLSEIRIVFSAEVDPNSLSKALGVTENGTARPGTLGVRGSCAQWTPLSPFAPRKEYRLTITTDAEDHRGNSLSQEFTHRWTTRPECDPPRIIAISPAGNSELTTPWQAITIDFSEPVDEASFVRAFSLDPTADFLCLFSPDFTQVRVIPQSVPKTGHRVTVKISADLEDLAGNPLRESFVSTFLNGIDRDPPRFTLDTDKDSSPVCLLPSTPNRGIPRNCVLRWQFDEPVAVDSLAGFLSISPPVSLKTVPDRQTGASAVLQLTLTWGETYILTVKPGIVDLSGNQTKVPSEWILVCDREDERPPEVVQAFLELADFPVPQLVSISPATNFDTILFPAAHYPAGSPVSAALFFVVRISPDASGISPISAMRAVRIQPANDCAVVDIRRMDTGDLSEPLFAELGTVIAGAPGQGRLVGIRVQLEITNHDAFGMITWTIAASLCDDLGNTLQKPWEAI
ncbi:MAG: Ig-like domain-containing protein, partial [Spirochaetaceae bacterium]|nr:Ig-like domain-containing protein [Spirochaetaceae bacterium]